MAAAGPQSFAYRERGAGEHLQEGSEHCAYHRLVAGRGPNLHAVTVTHWFWWCFRIEVRKVGLGMFPFRSNTEVVVK
jgi:hypothetical protein